MLYPAVPSIVEKISLVNVSIKSTSFLTTVPKLNNLIFDSNSIIGRVARCSWSRERLTPAASALFIITS